ARVAVVGAGPAGLTCAYLLGRQGFRVTLFDPARTAGGFLKGAKGLPATVLGAEVERLVRLGGVKLALGAGCRPEEIMAGKPGPALVVADDSAHPASAAWPIPEPPGDAAPWLRSGPGRGGKAFKPSQVSLAIGLGQALAAQALAALAGEAYAPPVARPVVEAEAIKLTRFTPEKPTRKAPARLDADRARYEAGRCMSCGTCNLCQQCVLFCPDACLAPDPEGAGVRVDLYHCKGCGICAEECPRAVISMEAGQ
ncbi:MAG: FAD-dependent oxidoreductase, partial [Pseudomonadota bacterium]